MIILLERGPLEDDDDDDNTVHENTLDDYTGEGQNEQKTKQCKYKKSYRQTAYVGSLVTMLVLHVIDRIILVNDEREWDERGFGQLKFLSAILY